MRMRIAASTALLLASLAGSATAQGIVLDQGEFAVTIGGRQVGTESFVLRRAGVGREDAMFANGVVTLTVDGARQEIHPLLSATPPDGIASAYQVKVTGADAFDMRLNLNGRRYVARISSAVGNEDREFVAHPDTRVVERGVAHQYYFLRDLRDGRSAHVLEPRSRRQVEWTVAARGDEELTIGRNVVQARRVEFAQGDDRRIVWYDRQGRVLRVEIPADGYVAERTDVVG